MVKDKDKYVMATEFTVHVAPKKEKSLIMLAALADGRIACLPVSTDTARTFIKDVQNKIAAAERPAEPPKGQTRVRRRERRN